MKKAPRTNSTYNRTVARKLGLTTSRGRLIALFVSVAVVATVTLTATSSAKSVRALLPGSPFGTGVSSQVSDKSNLSPAPDNNTAQPSALRKTIDAVVS